MLSPAEKFPEAFQDPNASMKYIEELNATISNSVVKIVKKMGDDMYYSINPTMSRKTPRYPQYKRSIKTTKRVNACSNKSRVKGVPDHEIIYYKEGDSIYCFGLSELYEQITLNNDIINPETNKPFDKAFLDRFSELYNKRLAETGFLSEHFQKKYGFSVETVVEEKEKVATKKRRFDRIAVNLWDIVNSDITELED